VRCCSISIGMVMGTPTVTLLFATRAGTYLFEDVGTPYQHMQSTAVLLFPCGPCMLSDAFCTLEAKYNKTYATPGERHHSCH
jgi:hypothetical protein